jgi:hypothetical protein
MKTVKFVLTFSLLAAGAACNFIKSQPAKADNQAQKPAVEVASVETAPVPTPTPTPEETADSLIRDLYKVHGEDMKSTSRDRIMSGKSRALLDKYFDKNLADLIWKDITTHVGEIGVIDWDIFYAPQDPQIKNVVVAPAAVNGDKATVRVTFTNYTAKEIVTYLMAKEREKWKIHDIKYTTGGTLLQAFEEDAKAQKEQTEEER